MYVLYRLHHDAGLTVNSGPGAGEVTAALTVVTHPGGETRAPGQGRASRTRISVSQVDRNPCTRPFQSAASTDRASACFSPPTWTDHRQDQEAIPAGQHNPAPNVDSTRPHRSLEAHRYPNSGEVKTGPRHVSTRRRHSPWKAQPSASLPPTGGPLVQIQRSSRRPRYQGWRVMHGGFPQPGDAETRAPAGPVPAHPA